MRVFEVEPGRSVTLNESDKQQSHITHVGERQRAWLAASRSRHGKGQHRVPGPFGHAQTPCPPPTYTHRHAHPTSSRATDLEQLFQRLETTSGVLVDESARTSHVGTRRSALQSTGESVRFSSRLPRGRRWVVPADYANTRAATTAATQGYLAVGTGSPSNRRSINSWLGRIYGVHVDNPRTGIRGMLHWSESRVPILINAYLSTPLPFYTQCTVAHKII